MPRSDETAIARTICWRPPAEAPVNRPVLVAGGVAIRREDGWYSITGEEWPGRPIQWEVVAWTDLPSGREAAEAAKLFDHEARELAASERISAALATYDDVIVSYGPDDPESDVHAFEAMKAALAKAEAMRVTETAPLTSPLGGDDLAKALRDAYGRGFSQSGEGYNGEHPGDTHEKKSWQNDRDAWIAQYIARLPAAEPKGASFGPGSCPSGPTASRSSGFAAAIPSRGPAAYVIVDPDGYPYWPSVNVDPDAAWRRTFSPHDEVALNTHRQEGWRCERLRYDRPDWSSGWQPISTAPKAWRDEAGRGRYVWLIARYPGSPTWTDQYYSWRDPDGAWVRWPHYFEPTHWMDAPAPPSALAGEAEGRDRQGSVHEYAAPQWATPEYRCINGHDLCHGGYNAGPDCQYCEPEATPKSSPDQTPVDPPSGWRTMADCPSDGRPVWVAGGTFEVPILKEADGDWWRSATAAGLGRPTHWHPEILPPDFRTFQAGGEVS